MLRRTLPALRSVKDGVTDAARQAASGDAHFPSLRGHPAARVNARESAEGQGKCSSAHSGPYPRGSQRLGSNALRFVSCAFEVTEY